MMDLAALRVRDTIKNLGDLPAIAARFTKVTGERVDYDVVDYDTVLYNALTVLSAAPPLAAPERTTDLMSHMAWYVNSARWALEVMADILGVELAPVDEPADAPSRHAPSHTHLAKGLRALVAEDPEDYELGALQRVARHLVRIDEIGPAVARADLDDLEELLGHRPSEEDADRALLTLVDDGGPEQDAELVRLLDRRMQRAHLLMAPPGSLLLLHPRLRSIRPGAGGADGGDESWPPGAIPGTR
jgi:hypothetical protein